MSPDQAIQIVQSHFSIRLKPVTDGEYRSLNGCPQCGDGGKGHSSDRFRVFTDNSPRWWCRRCGFQGFIDEINGDRWHDLGWKEKRRRMAASEIRAQQYEMEQAALRRSALKTLRKSGDDDRYYQALLRTPRAWEYWKDQGFADSIIHGFRLGYCSACPMDYPQHRPSVTIPVYVRNLLWDIRHRILGAKDGDKYRPAAKHLPRVLFNADNLFDAPADYIMLVEGEKKSIAATQAGWWSVGVMGQDSFNRNWVDAFNRFETIYVVLDPDALKNAREIAALFGGRGCAIQLPGKLDDLLRDGYGANKIWKAIQKGATHG